MSSSVIIREDCGLEVPAYRLAALPSPPPQPEATSFLPGHELLEMIAEGGMGSVHRARQGSLQREVAVKIILPTRITAEDTERFLREARVLAQLDHPNIVPIYDSGTDDEGRCFYTMKMVRGRTLKGIIFAARTGAETWTLERLLEVFRKVCDALAFAHARGVLHRDVKPDNIMVGEFGEVLVMDWGLAGEIKVAADGSAPRAAVAVESPRGRALPADLELTMDGMVMGTPQYMSPEQANGCSDLDARSDVYGLGGILYSILALRPPVRKEALDDMLTRVRTGQIEPFESVPLPTGSAKAQWRIPPALAAVVRKAMALEREDRFPTVAALAADVDAHLAGYATSAEEMGPAGQLWLFIKRHRTVSVAALLLTMVSAAFVFRLIASEGRATQNAEIAQRNEDSARQSERLAQKNEMATRRALARSNTALADSAYAGHDSAQMRAALDAVPAELRDPNWHYLDTRADARQALIEWEKDSFFIGGVPHPSQPGVFTAATSARTNRIVTFEAKTGKVLSDFSQRGGWVRGLAYSPDGQLIALSRIMEGGISIHSAEDGAELNHWPSGWADSVAFLPDGKRLLQSDNSGCIMWEVATGRALWKSPSGRTHLLLPDGQRIASVSDTTLRLHSAEDGAEIARYPLEGNVPITASISPDGELFIVALTNGQIRAVRLADGATAFETPGGEVGSIIRTAFCADGKRFVVVASLNDTTQSVQLRDTATGRVLRHMRGGIGGVESVSIHPLSGDLLIAGARSATWPLPQTREPGWRLGSSLVTAKSPGGFLSGDDLFLTPVELGVIAAIDLGSARAHWQPSRSAFPNSAASTDGRTGVVQNSGRQGSGYNFTIIRADGAAIRETGSFYFGTDPSAMSLNRDGSRIALSGSWGGIDTFLATSGERLPVLSQNDISETHGLAWHGADPSRLIGIFNRHERRGFPLAEEWIISWDAGTGRRIAALRHPTGMNCLAAEPGGPRLAEAGDDKLVRIRDAGTLEVLREFRAHDGPISAIAWDPKSPILATGSTDRSVRLWDVETGRLIEELHIGQREPSSLYFSPSGRRLACVTAGEKTLIWDLRYADLARVR